METAVRGAPAARPLTWSPATTTMSICWLAPLLVQSRSPSEHNGECAAGQSRCRFRGVGLLIALTAFPQGSASALRRPWCNRKAARDIWEALAYTWDWRFRAHAPRSLMCTCSSAPSVADRGVETAPRESPRTQVVDRPLRPVSHTRNPGGEAEYGLGRSPPPEANRAPRLCTSIRSLLRSRWRQVTHDRRRCRERALGEEMRDQEGLMRITPGTLSWPRRQGG